MAGPAGEFTDDADGLAGTEGARGSAALRRERDPDYRAPNLERYLDGGGRVAPV